MAKRLRSLRKPIVSSNTIRALQLAVETAEKEAQYWLEQDDIRGAKDYIRDRNIYHGALSDLLGVAPSPLRWNQWFRVAKKRRWYSLY